MLDKSPEDSWRLSFKALLPMWSTSPMSWILWWSNAWRKNSISFFDKGLKLGSLETGAFFAFLAIVAAAALILAFPVGLAAVFLVLVTFLALAIICLSS